MYDEETVVYSQGEILSSNEQAIDTYQYDESLKNV